MQFVGHVVCAIQMNQQLRQRLELFQAQNDDNVDRAEKAPYSLLCPRETQARQRPTGHRRRRSAWPRD